MFGLGMQELVVVGIVAIILFGKRLPDVAKTFGKSYSEFRRSLSEIQSQFDLSDTYTPRYSSTPQKRVGSVSYDEDDYEKATSPKFEPPPAEPSPTASADAP